MKDENPIITVDGPVIEGYLSLPHASGVIYSVSLSNGMVVTSPEGFEVITNMVNHKPHDAPGKPAGLAPHCP
jgi:hypothetical protein